MPSHGSTGDNIMMELKWNAATGVTACGIVFPGFWTSPNAVPSARSPQRRRRLLSQDQLAYSPTFES
jgi:hypothetical protein